MAPPPIEKSSHWNSAKITSSVNVADVKLLNWKCHSVVVLGNASGA